MIKVSDITIITSDLPPEVVKKPNKETTNLLGLLLSSDYFNDFVEYFLTESETPVLSIDDFIKQLKEKFQKSENTTDEEYIESTKAGFEYLKNTRSILFEPYEKEFYEFVSLLSLPTYFAWDIFLLIQFRAFRELDTENYPDIVYLPTLSDIASATKQNNEYYVSSALLIQHQLPKKDLIRWIEENWEDIDLDMKEYLPQSPLKDTYFHDMGLTAEMYSLLKQGNSPTQILKKLEIKYSTGKYSNDTEIYDKLSLDYIKNKLSRYKKLISREIDPKDRLVIKTDYSITILD